MSAAAVLTIARSQLGTVESPANSNRTKYGAAYGMNGVAWCAQFTWWCMVQAGHAALVPKSAYTPTIYDWYRKQGRTGSAPRVGALVFFDFPGDGVNRISHIAFVEAVNRDGSIITIEGNTSSGNAGSQRDGGGVWRRTRRTGIVGYAYPAYPNVSPKPAVPPAKVGAEVGVVGATQAIVRVTADGIWGRGTDGAINLVRDATRGVFTNIPNVQRIIGTAPDGIWGPASRAALKSTVIALQRTWGIGADGIWGQGTERTWKGLRAKYGRGL